VTKRIGRNDPCPCGSGKKYKKCCQAKLDETDFQYRRWRQIEARLLPELLSYALETLGPESIVDAWTEFHDDSPDQEYEPGTPMDMLFMPWFLFNWIHEMKPPGAKRFRKTTIAESFLNEHDLSVDEQKLILSAIRAPYSLYEVVEVTPGIGMTLFDLLRRIKCEAVERSGSHMFKRGEILYCATTSIDGITSNISTGPYALRPTTKRDILELRKRILDLNGRAKITKDNLALFEADIRSFYLDTVKAMFRPPQLVNTDQDPFLPQKIHFDIESAHNAFHTLKDLAEDTSEEALLADATMEGDRLSKAEIPWLGGSDEARKRLGGPVLLGTIKIENRKLIVEVNSSRRAETIRKLIEERLRNEATYKTTLLEPIESSVNEMWEAAAAGSTTAERPRRDESSNQISLAEMSPEFRVQMEETARQHWIAWMDLPVPALNNMTPREASKTEEGRDLLESLLLFYESHDDESGENLMRPDMPALRRELGMYGATD
jgi:hypothetical protein